MEKIKFYSVSDDYIKFLCSDPKLSPHVRENKKGQRVHTRKYIGIVLRQEDLNYFVPMVCPKDTDYIMAPNGSKSIRKSIIPIIRITALNTRTGELELKGTMRFNNMIPVPDSELTPYSISDEPDRKYAQVVSKEYSFISKNRKKILNNAKVLYNQRTNTDRIFPDGTAPNYLASVVDFAYAEKKCREYIRKKEQDRLKEAEKPQERTSVKQMLKQLETERRDNPAIISPLKDQDSR